MRLHNAYPRNLDLDITRGGSLQCDCGKDGGIKERMTGSEEMRGLKGQKSCM